eukprot:1560562-Rhodomonas_salina.1
MGLPRPRTDGGYGAPMGSPYAVSMRCPVLRDRACPYQALPILYPLLLEFMPKVAERTLLRKSNAKSTPLQHIAFDFAVGVPAVREVSEETKINYSAVECALYSFHQVPRLPNAHTS